jgi:hypothetical protein
MLTPRQRGFVVGKLEGKTDRQAALDAGYAPSTAENTKQKIMSRPEVRQAFQELLDEHLPLEKLVRCITEGLDATQVKFFSREGDVVETVVLPDHRVRLLFVMLALKLKGWDLPAAEAAQPTKIIVSWKGDEPEWSPDA